MQPLPLALAVKLWLNNTVFADPFTLRFFTFLLSLGTELTENQCQSVQVMRMGMDENLSQTACADRVDKSWDPKTSWPAVQQRGIKPY